MMTAPLRVVCDNREQRPYDFTRFPWVETVRGTLQTGDYAPYGYEGRAAIERKSIDDLLGVLTTGRDRFERELARGRDLAFFAVVIEASMLDVARGHYTSRMEPHAALQSILTFQVRYSAPFIWASTRAGAEYATAWLLQKFVREVDPNAGKVPLPPLPPKPIPAALARPVQSPQSEAEAVHSLEALARQRDRKRQSAKGGAAA